MRDAINLDGGGSTTMAIRGKLANKVSGSRERSVSDALVWTRRR
jgi:exopolysaccharide biosynthesis protein